MPPQSRLDFEKILKSPDVKNRINDTKSDDLLNSLASLSKEDVQELENAINDNKRESWWIPNGTIKFKGKDIPIDLIFENFPDLKSNYEEALKKQGNEKDVALNRANRHLIQCILLLMDRVWKIENQVKINWEKSDFESFNMEEFKSKLSSRDNVANQICEIRSNSDTISWSIELRDWVSIDLSDDRFSSIIREYNLVYKRLKTEKSKSKLDTRLAERLILESGYIIQINNPLLSLHDSNYKDSRSLTLNLTNCKKWLWKIWISTDAIK